MADSDSKFRDWLWQNYSIHKPQFIGITHLKGLACIPGEPSEIWQNTIFYFQRNNWSNQSQNSFKRHFEHLLQIENAIFREPNESERSRTREGTRIIDFAPDLGLSVTFPSLKFFMHRHAGRDLFDDTKLIEEQNPASANWLDILRDKKKTLNCFEVIEFAKFQHKLANVIRAEIQSEIDLKREHEARQAALSEELRIAKLRTEWKAEKERREQASPQAPIRVQAIGQHGHVFHKSRPEPVGAELSVWSKNGFAGTNGRSHAWRYTNNELIENFNSWPNSQLKLEKVYADHRQESEENFVAEGLQRLLKLYRIRLYDIFDFFKVSHNEIEPLAEITSSFVMKNYDYFKPVAANLASKFIRRGYSLEKLLAEGYEPDQIYLSVFGMGKPELNQRVQEMGPRYRDSRFYRQTPELCLKVFEDGLRQSWAEFVEIGKIFASCNTIDADPNLFVASHSVKSNLDRGLWLTGKKALENFVIDQKLSVSAEEFIHLALKHSEVLELEGDAVEIRDHIAVLAASHARQLIDIADDLGLREG